MTCLIRYCSALPGSDNLLLAPSPGLEAIINQMQSLKKELEQSSHNLLLKDVHITGMCG
jgi:hypothetical protein